jgi:hypothetical protein
MSQQPGGKKKRINYNSKKIKIGNNPKILKGTPGKYLKLKTQAKRCT